MALLKSFVRLWEATALAAATAALTTGTIDTSTMRDLTLLLKVVATGVDADVSITYAASMDGVTFSPFTDNVVAASTIALFAGSPEVLHEYAFAPKARYIQVKVINLTAGASVVDGRLQFTEET